jgi:hypothetical protein
MERKEISEEGLTMDMDFVEKIEPEPIEKTDEYYVAFANAVLRLLKATNKGKIPMGLKVMSKDDAGLLIIGKMTDAKLVEAGDINYGMLQYQAVDEVRRKKEEALKN